MSQSCRGCLSSLSRRWAQVMLREYYNHSICNAYCLCYQSTVKEKKPSWYWSSPTFIFQRIYITCWLLDFFVLIEQGRVLVETTSWVRTQGPLGLGMLWGNVWKHFELHWERCYVNIMHDSAFSAWEERQAGDASVSSPGHSSAVALGRFQLEECSGTCRLGWKGCRLLQEHSRNRGSV